MKISSYYIHLFLITVVVCLASCDIETEPEFSESLDPDFVPDTILVSLTDSADFISFCGYKNNYFLLDASMAPDSADDHSYVWTNESQSDQILVQNAGLYGVNISHEDSINDIHKFVDLTFCPTVVYIPNSFTPNGDGMNDEWGPQGDGVDYIQTIVENGSSLVLFESDDMNEKWNGMYDGQLIQAGTYFYTVSGRFKSGVLFTYIGSVELFQ